MAVLRDAVCSVLENTGGFRVTGAADLGELLALVREYRPDVVLVDLELPPDGGFDALLHLSEFTDTRPVLWTFRTDVDVLHAVRLGANGLLSKDIAPDGLIRAVRATAEGEVALSRYAASRMIGSLRALESREQARARTAALSHREREVLALIADGCRNREIAVRLYISELTVKRHVQNILRKVGRPNRTEAAQLYRLADEPAGAAA